MDTIYSRRKIKTPKLQKFFSDNNCNRKKQMKIIAILLIAIITVLIVLKSVSPIFEAKCIEKAQEIATNITNIESSRILKQTNYSNIVELVKDENGNISVIKTDVVKINEIASDIAVAIQEKLTQTQNENIRIPIGSFTGNRYLAGFGPSVKIKVIPAGNIITDIKTEFVSTGINQSVHRIYLELRCNSSILTPFNTYEKEIVNQVLLVETVIIGDIPSSYYNLEGMKSNNMVDIIK